MHEGKITLFINALHGGGAERVCVNIANGLSNKGFEVTLLALHLNGAVYQKELHENVTLRSLNITNARKAFWALKKYLDVHQPEKILVFNHQLAVLLVLLRKLFRYQCTLVARNINTLSKKYEKEGSFWHKYIVQNIVKFLYKDVDTIITQSKGMALDLMNAFTIDTQKMVTINNPVNQTIENAAGSIDLAEIHKNHEILFVGSLTEQKGLDYLLNAFALVLKQDPALKLRIVGSGPLKKHLEEKTSYLKMTDHVIFEPFSSNVIPFYLQAKATVLTSLYEGFPNVLVESITLGTPVIAFDCASGPDEIIEEGMNGYLVPLGNFDLFAERILEILSHSMDPLKVQQSAQRFYNGLILERYIRVLNG